MSCKAVYVTSLGVVACYLCSATVAKADDQQLVDDYLKTRGANGYVIRPITDDYVGRTFPNFSFFGVIFRQYPIAVLCPQARHMNCANVFFVKNGHLDFVVTVPHLKCFF